MIEDRKSFVFAAVAASATKKLTFGHFDQGTFLA